MARQRNSELVKQGKRVRSEDKRSDTNDSNERKRISRQRNSELVKRKNEQTGRTGTILNKL